MNMTTFLAQNRAEIDRAIGQHIRNGTVLTDSERRLWVLNDEALYRWARSEGVRI